MTVENSNRLITNQKVIAGLIREALLVRCTLHVDGAVGFIVGIEELDRRDGLEQRRFNVALQSDYVPAQGHNSQIVLSFARFQVEFLAQTLKSSSDCITFLAPTAANVSNRRTARRFNAKYIPYGPHPALLSCEAHQYEVSLDLVDLSANGYRAILSSRRSVSPKVGMKIEGQISTAVGPVDLGSEIVSVSEKKESGLMSEVHVGCFRPQSPESGKKGSNDEDRRVSPRFSSNIQMNFVSPVNPARPASMTLENVSVGGFSAKIPASDFRDLLFVGATLSVVDRSLTATVVAADSTHIHCQWVSGREDDRSFLLKQISPFLADGATLSTTDAADLLNIFCESGALGGDFLAAHAQYQEAIKTEIETESSDLPYVIRWIHQSNEGAISGHISAIKAADNMWIIGDVVGGVDTTRKVGREFLAKFLRNFRLHSEKITPTPRIFVSYVEGHPYWTDYEAFLTKFTEPLCFRACMSYTRTTAPDVGTPDNSVTMNAVEPHEFGRIDAICNEVTKSGVHQFLRALDFSIDQFGSPRLQKQILDARHFFWRRYYEVRCGPLRYLTVLTQFPIGTTPNRLIDSAWCFRIGSDTDSCGKSWAKIVSAIRSEGLKHGVSVPSIRRMHVSSYSYETEVAKLDCRLIHPSGLLFF